MCVAKKEPTMGVTPFSVWVALRKQEVEAAIERFDRDLGKHPKVWDEELVLLQDLSESDHSRNCLIVKGDSEYVSK